MKTKIITGEQYIKKTTTAERKKVSSTSNSDNEEQSEQLERERLLKEKINIEPEQPVDKVETRGRKKKVVDVELEQFQEKFSKIESGMKHFVSFGLDFLAERMPKKIPVSDIEKDFISESVTEVLKKYKPSMIDYFPEICLVASVVVFTIPRMQNKKGKMMIPVTDEELKEIKKEEKINESA
jgi:hypothetical protein